MLRQGTRGQAIAALAEMRGVRMNEIDRDDPLVAMFARLPADVIDCIRIRFDRDRDLYSSAAAVIASLLSNFEAE